MAVTKKTVGNSKSPKPTAKSGNSKVAAAKITTARLHTTVDASGGFQ
jgi:hypothetical protein